jgi:hypothetical protein
MDIMPQMTSQTNMSYSVTSQTVTTHESLPKIKKPTYKSIMADLLKPLPKDDKPNIHLGGGQFTKLEKI